MKLVRIPGIHQWVRVMILTAVVGCTAGALLAQGCVMCKSSIAAQGENVINSLGLGILVLLIPPMLIMSAILFVAFRDDE